MLSHHHPLIITRHNTDELRTVSAELRDARGSRPYPLFHPDGTQSTVRKVLRRDTRQIFAAKIYESFLVKARNEIDMLVRLDHPSIVNIYEVYE
jgi:serine/threonine protein kinase